MKEEYEPLESHVRCYFVVTCLLSITSNNFNELPGSWLRYLRLLVESVWFILDSVFYACLKRYTGCLVTPAELPVVADTESVPR